WTPPESNPQPQKTDDLTGSKTTKSFPTESCPAISHLINDKATRLREIKTAFKERVEEISQSYADVLELKARRCAGRAGGRVLEKLRGFAEQQSLRVPPQVLLKVLGGLEPWELCLPELCVAVQIATEHVVHMPRRSTTPGWVQGSLCSHSTAVPLKHQVTHTH
ncbi:hypothetical protein F7725_013167, partial [Dissostichus mawsoni]